MITLFIEGRYMITVTKKDLIALGYGPSFSSDIIRQAKILMIERGHTYYQSRKLDGQTMELTISEQIWAMIL